MNDPTTKLLRELRPREAEHVDDWFPAERRTELMRRIMSGTSVVAIQDRVGTPSRRWRLLGTTHAVRRPAVLSALGVTAAAIVAAVVMMSTGAVSPAPAQAVAFHNAPDGAIIATVTEPFAAQAQLDAAFAKQGLKITVRLVPSSPSAVGTVVSFGESNPGVSQVRPLQGGSCMSGGGGCAIGIEIPRSFTGEGTIYLGRPAKPGETYEASNSAFAPGEWLHCSGLLGARVAAALPVLESKHLSIEWRELVEEGGTSHSVTETQPPLQNYIHDATPMAPGKLMVETAPAPWPDTPGSGSEFNKGC
jgi:hypothetical protein